MTTKASGAGRGRVWRSVAGVAVAATVSIGGAQVVRADEPIVDTVAPPVAPAADVQTATPPVVESNAPGGDATDEPIVAVGLPPVPDTVTVVAVGLPPVPQVPHVATDHGRRGPDAGTARDVLAPQVSGAVAGALAAAALEDWIGS